MSEKCKTKQVKHQDFEYFSEMKTHLEVKEKLFIWCRQYQGYQKVYKRTFEDVLDDTWNYENEKKAWKKVDDLKAQKPPIILPY